MTAALGALFLALNNLVCRGSPTHFSYGDETFQFQSPLIGLTQQFYGIKRNLLLFNPALLLTLTGWVVLYRTARWRRLLVACLLIWVVYVPFYSSWYEWDGGMCLGRVSSSRLSLSLCSPADLDCCGWRRTPVIVSGMESLELPYAGLCLQLFRCRSPDYASRTKKQCISVRSQAGLSPEPTFSSWP